MEDTNLSRNYCVCAINSDEGQSLTERGHSGFTFGELSDYVVNNKLEFLHINNSEESTKIKSLNGSCDQLPLRNALETLHKFLSKRFVKNNFYFIFSRVEGKSECDKNNSQSSCSLSDYYNRRNGERVDSMSAEEGGSVFGSPLKLEPIADISLNETTSDCLSTTNEADQHTSRLVGLPIFEARKILSKFCQQKELKDSVLKAMVVFCDFSGVQSTTSQKTILLGCLNDVDGDNRKLTTFKVMCHNKKHNLSFLEPLDLPSGCVCPMECSYELLEQKDKSRKLRIDANWSNCHGNSIISNLHTAQFSLHVTAPFGCKESPLFKHLGQLKHILMLCKGLKEGELPSALSTKPYNAQENVNNLFVRIKNGIQDKKSPEVGGGKGKRINLTSSYSADITDDLWEIFAQCEAYQDMVLCLKITFNMFKKNEFPLFVRNDNDTLLARLVRQSSSGLTYFPPLTDLMPLKIITELGLEHMKKIYSAILLQNELVSPNDIDNFLTESLKEDTNANLSMSVAEPDHQMKEALVETVKKLHHCVDLVCLVDLHTENVQLKAVASHILNHYRLTAFSERDSFFIPLDSRQASLEVEKLSPCVVRREYNEGEQGHVECLLSEMPEELCTQSHQQNITADTSIINEVTKECFKFTTEENVMFLGKPCEKQ